MREKGVAHVLHNGALFQSGKVATYAGHPKGITGPYFNKKCPKS